MTAVLDRPHTHYEQLGVSPAATQQEIAAAYARHQAEWQALVERGDPDALARLRAIDEAYAALADPARRVAYDRTLDNQRAHSSTSLVPSSAQVLVPGSPPAPAPAYACPHCGALNPIQLAVCQACGQQVTRPCPSCRTPVPLAEAICSRCNTAIDDYNRRRFEEAMHSTRQIEKERQATTSRVQGQEALNRMWGRQAIVFWATVALGCAALTALAWFVIYFFSTASGG